MAFVMATALRIKHLLRRSRKALKMGIDTKASVHVKKAYREAYMDTYEYMQKISKNLFGTLEEENPCASEPFRKNLQDAFPDQSSGREEGLQILRLGPGTIAFVVTLVSRSVFTWISQAY